MATTSYGTPYVVSADLVSGYPGTSLSLADRIDDISFKGNGINNQTGTTYTLDILDAGKTVTLNNSSAVTVTIPTNTAEAIEIGSVIRFNNKGVGTVTIQPDGGVTLNGGNITLEQNAGVQIVKLDTNTWGQLDSVASTPGLTLISPTSIANSGGSASSTAGTTSFTGVSSISLNGVFSATYENYLVTVNVTSVAADADISGRLRASGTDNSTASSYVLTAFYASANTPYAINWTENSLNMASVDSATTDYAMQIQLFGPYASRRTLGFETCSNVDTSNVFYARQGSWRHTQAVSYDGLTVLGSAAITGTIRVYGYKGA